ncbi:MAG: hypothetical protein U9N79_02245 [Actinomycetota bacterium]|nr:hypothetical protein [Actinomycetota bacterium]
MDRNPAIWEETQIQVGLTGWGRRLLDVQDADRTWGGGLYSPKWTSTTYTLLLLRRLGLTPSNDGAISGCVRLLDDATWVEGGVSYWSGRDLAERCVNGMVLSLVSYFDVEDPRVDSIAELLLSVVMPDGGWNCRDHQGATHSSFHTTTDGPFARPILGRERPRHPGRESELDQGAAQCSSSIPTIFSVTTRTNAQPR